MKNLLNMVRRLLSLVCFLFFLGFTTAMAQAVVKFEKITHDFGEIPEGKSVSYTFKFTNTGDQPLVVHQAFPGCGCTVTDYTKDPIAPGESGEVKAVFNSDKQFPGKFKKPITVRSNASNQMVRLYIMGTITAKEKVAAF